MSVSAEVPAQEPSPLAVIEDATCTACACACDDIVLKVDRQQIVEARQACELGKNWFLNHTEAQRPVCTINGQPATLEAGIHRAAEILTAARYPLVYGLNETTSEAQRVAVAIADRIGGNMDTTTSLTQGPAGMAFQGVGEVTCTLGEIRNRGDLILLWGTNPAESHPRLLTRYALTPKGMLVPRGRLDRTAVLIDTQQTKTADACDFFLRIKPHSDFAAIWTLRALAKGLELDATEVAAETGVPLAAWQNLMARMKAARFGVLLFGVDDTLPDNKHLNTDALLALTRDMNAYTRFVCKSLSGPGNIIGADGVVNWQTGFPNSVNLSRGYPRYSPGEYSASELLARREVDAALIVASDPMATFAQPARDHLASIPYISLSARETATTQAAAVAFTTATYGIQTPGTVYRLDDVSLPLRPAIASNYPSDQSVLEKILGRVNGEE